MIDRWARLGSAFPRARQRRSARPGIGALIRRALHLADEREMPRLAPGTFRRWARRNGVPTLQAGIRGSALSPPPAGRDVILWADTFNNYFHPETAVAAIEVLGAAGFSVSVPAGAPLLRPPAL